MVIIYIDANDIKISYEVEGDGDPIILLHGWGANKNTFNKLSNELKENFKVYKIDLPGFGDTEIGLPLSVHVVSEYIYEFTKIFNIDNPILICHSYGGRIGIIFASKYKVKKLILVSSAGVREKLRISRKMKIKAYKMLKKIGIKVKMGSKDYLNCDNVKKAMLVNAVNTDLTEEMKKIKCPTLLIYGDKDTSTPLSIANHINENIKNSSLITLDDTGHFPYLEKPTIFNLILNSFLIGDEE